MTLKLIEPGQNTLDFFHPTFVVGAASDFWLVRIHSTPQLKKLSDMGLFFFAVAL
jgi:hypothetical protein